MSYVLIVFIEQFNILSPIFFLTMNNLQQFYQVKQLQIKARKIAKKRREKLQKKTSKIAKKKARKIARETFY